MPQRRPRPGAFLYLSPLIAVATVLLALIIDKTLATTTDRAPAEATGLDIAEPAFD